MSSLTTRFGVFLACVAIGMVLVGCSSDDADSTMAATTATTTSTTIPELPTVTGFLSIDKWTWYPGLGARVVRDGEYCRAESDGGYQDIAEGVSVVAKDSSGEIVGVGRLGEGAVLGLGPTGFEYTGSGPDNDVRSQFVAIKRRADCAFAFTMSLSTESPFYSFTVADRGDVTFSHDELEASGWVVGSSEMSGVG